MATTYQVRSNSHHHHHHPHPPPSLFTSNSQYGNWNLPSKTSGPSTQPHTHGAEARDAAGGVAAYTGSVSAAAGSRRLPGPGGPGLGYTSRYSTVTPGDIRRFVTRTSTAPSNPSGKFVNFFEKTPNPGTRVTVSPVSVENDLDLKSSRKLYTVPLTEVDSSSRISVSETRLGAGDYNKYSDVTTPVGGCNHGRHDSKLYTPLAERVSAVNRDPYGLAEPKHYPSLDRSYSTLDRNSNSSSTNLDLDYKSFERSHTFHGQLPSSSSSSSSSSSKKTDSSLSNGNGLDSEYTDSTVSIRGSLLSRENKPSSPLTVTETGKQLAPPPFQWLFNSRSTSHVPDPVRAPQYKPGNYLYQFEQNKERSSARAELADLTGSRREYTDNYRTDRDLLNTRRTQDPSSQYRDSEGPRGYLDFPESASNLGVGTYHLQPTPPTSAVPSSRTGTKSILKKTSKYSSATLPRSFGSEASYLRGGHSHYRELPHLPSTVTIRRSSSTRRVTFDLQ